MKTVTKTIIACLMLLMVTPTFAQDMGKHQRMKMAEANEKFEKLATQLSLSDDQSSEVKEILQEQMKKLKEVKADKKKVANLSEEEKKTARKEAMESMKEIESNTNTRLASVLSPEQMKKYLQIVEEKKAARKDDRKERMKHRPMKKGEMHQMEEEGASNN